MWVCRRDPSRRLPQLRHRHGVAPDKGVAVLLSVFWSFWTWLYIDKKDAGKFWIGLALAIFGGITALSLVGWLIVLGVWIWAIVDRATKPESYYVR